MKTNLFSRFRNLFRKSEPDYEDSYEEDYSDVIVDDYADEEESAEEGYEHTPVGDDLQMPAGASVPEAKPQGRGVHVPLAPIVAGMSIELQGRLMHDVGDLSVFLPLAQILPQLSKGVVSLPFGELRAAAPKIFVGNRDQDEVAVNVPLSAILPHISPDMLARKHGPLQMEIPEDIVSPFADKGKGLAIGSVKPVANAPAAPTSIQQPAAAPRPINASPVRPRPTAQPAPVAQPAPKPISMSPQRPTALPRPTLPTPSVTASKPQEPGVVPAIKFPTAPTGTTEKGTTILNKPSVPTPVEKPAATSVQPAAAAPVSSRPPLQLALTSVADGWPEPLKQEIIQLNLVKAQLAIPYALVEAGLKRGSLKFTWSQLKSWLVPPVTPGVSLHDAVSLELPLRVVAPLFIEQQKEKSKETPKVAVDKDIPNLFSGMPQPDTAGLAVDHSVTKPLDTNYYVWDDRNDVVPEGEDAAAAAARAASAGTEFVSRYATPNEVVSRAAALDGVEGAVIALPDGLMVASQLPPGLNGDTLAAFLPHLFGKVTQCTQELRMGELNNLNFTVGNVPWKIFRVNALYFAAFGAEAQPMPTARLAALAGELNHKAKV